MGKLIRDDRGRFHKRKKFTRSDYIAILAFITVIAALIIDIQVKSHTVHYVQAEEPVEPRVVLIELAPLKTEEEFRREVDKKAKEYKVSAERMWATIKCENPMLDPKIQSQHVKNGVQEKSWGLAQIHLPSHPYVSLEQAQDARFSIDFMAKEFSKNNARIWTCYRKLFSS